MTDDPILPPDPRPDPGPSNRLLVIALVARTDLEAIAAAVADRYRAETGREPNAFGEIGRAHV